MDQIAQSQLAFGTPAYGNRVAPTNLPGVPAQGISETNLQI